MTDNQKELVAGLEAVQKIAKHTCETVKDDTKSGKHKVAALIAFKLVIEPLLSGIDSAAKSECERQLMIEKVTTKGEKA